MNFKNTDKGNIDSVFLNSGIIILAFSVTFSIVLMNAAFGCFAIAFFIKLLRKNIKFYATGLELPLLIFLAAFMISAIFGSKNPLSSIRDISDNYWYLLYMYIVVCLFGSDEINKFVKLLGWAALAISVYTILQSAFGINPVLVYKKMKIINPGHEQIFALGGRPVYMGTGLMGHHLTFGGQIMMLVFMSYAAFKNKLPVIFVIIAFFLSFAYSAWFGFVFSLAGFIFFRRKRIIYAAGLIAVFTIALFLIPGNLDKTESKLKDRINIWSSSIKMFKAHPWLGVGAGRYKKVFMKEYAKKFKGPTRGARTHSHSIYLDILTEGGIITLAAFVFFLWRFFRVYLRLPSDPEWKKTYMACIMALVALFAAGLFQTYLTDAENSVLIWTLAGIVVKIHILEREQHETA